MLGHQLSAEVHCARNPLELLEKGVGIGVRVLENPGKLRATTSANISITEVAESLGIEEEISESWSRVQELSDDIRKLKSDMDDIRDQRDACDDLIDKIKQTWDKWEALGTKLADGATVYAPSSPSRKRKRESRPKGSRKNRCPSDVESDVSDADGSGSSDKETRGAQEDERVPLTSEQVDAKLARACQKLSGQLQKDDLNGGGFRSLEDTEIPLAFPSSSEIHIIMAIPDVTCRPDQLFRRRSFDALPIELQDAIFFATQCLTQAAGILLQLPQSVTAQANVLLARYWLVEPMMSHEFSDVSAAIVYLAAKLSAHPRSPRDLANVYAYLLSPSSSFFQPPTAPPPANEPAGYYLSESAYHAFRARVLALEARALYALAFDTHVALPHPLAVTYLQA
ncbi:hypothetical protein VTH06DRAFT_2908, partial [Thermothelomyces fergusii]